MKASLESQELYTDDGQYRLTITLMKVDQPLLSFDTTVTTHIRYVLKDTQSGNAVLDETIVASYTATAGDAFLGVERLRFANEGSAKKIFRVC